MCILTFCSFYSHPSLKLAADIDRVNTVGALDLSLRWGPTLLCYSPHYKHTLGKKFEPTNTESGQTSNPNLRQSQEGEGEEAESSSSGDKDLLAATGDADMVEKAKNLLSGFQVVRTPQPGV